jgi:glycosyltransferase involved in cell wall biosynthesis
VIFVALEWVLRPCGDTPRTKEIRLRCWLIQTGEPVPLTREVKRMRTALLADQMVSQGHEVVWWASAFDHGSKSFVANGGGSARTESGIDLRILPALGYRRNLSLGRYLDHRHVARQFKRAVRDVSDPPDLIVAASPDYHIAAEAAEYASERAIPYVIDVRDSWPDSFVDPVPTRWGKALARGVLRSDFGKVRRMLRGAVGIVGMMESMLEWGLEQAGRARRPEDRVFYLGTEPLPAPDPSFLADLRRSIGPSGRPVVVYVGTFGQYNHPGALVEAVRLIENDGRDRPFDVVIAGSGDLYESIRSRADGLPGVHFTGWLRASQISAVLVVGALGMVPWTQGVAFPNKAFAYLEAGLPILTSASGDLRQIVAEEAIGDYYRSGDVPVLAEALCDLTSDRARLDAMTARVRSVYPRRFTADDIYRDYAQYLESLVDI